MMNDESTNCCSSDNNELICLISIWVQRNCGKSIFSMKCFQGCKFTYFERKLIWYTHLCSFR